MHEHSFPSENITVTAIHTGSFRGRRHRELLPPKASHLPPSDEQSLLNPEGQTESTHINSWVALSCRVFTESVLSRVYITAGWVPCRCLSVTDYTAEPPILRR